MVFGSALIFAAQSATAQTVWNPTTDFSLTNGNPNGVWTYGWMDTGFTTFTPDTSHTTSAWDGNVGGDGSPIIWINGSTLPINGTPPGDIAFHPGPGGEASVLRWTAPASFFGTAHVAGQFLAGDVGVMQVAIRFNGSTVWNATDAGAFDFFQAFVPGNQFDFAVFGGYAFGTTPLEMNITSAIPEPSTCAALFGLVAVGFAAHHRRHRPAASKGVKLLPDCQPPERRYHPRAFQ